MILEHLKKLLFAFVGDSVSRIRIKFPKSPKVRSTIRKQECSANDNHSQLRDNLLILKNKSAF